MSVPPWRASSPHSSSDSPSPSIEAPATLYRPSAIEEAFSHVDRVQAMVKATASSHDRVPLGHEHNYWVNRKRDLRVNKLKQGKTKFKPGVKQGVAKNAIENVLKQQTKEKKRKAREELWGEEFEQRERDRELFEINSDDEDKLELADVVMGGVQDVKGTDEHGKNHGGSSGDKPEKPKSSITMEIERKQSKAAAKLARIKEKEKAKADMLVKKHKEADMANVSRSIERRAKTGTIVKPPKPKKKLFRHWDSPPDMTKLDETQPTESGQKETSPTVAIESQVTEQPDVEPGPVQNQPVPRRVVRKKQITDMDHLFLPRNQTRKRMPAQRAITIHQDEAAERAKSYSPLFFDDGNGSKSSAPDNKRAKLLGELRFDEDDEDVVEARPRRRRLGPDAAVEKDPSDKSMERTDGENGRGVRGWLPPLPSP